MYRCCGNIYTTPSSNCKSKGVDITCFSNFIIFGCREESGKMLSQVIVTYSWGNILRGIAAPKSVLHLLLRSSMRFASSCLRSVTFLFASFLSSNDSFHHYFLTTYHVLDTLLNAGDIMVVDMNNPCKARSTRGWKEGFIILQQSSREPRKSKRMNVAVSRVWEGKRKKRSRVFLTMQ